MSETSVKPKAGGCPHFPAFDPLHPEQISNPHPILAAARAEQPVFYMDKYDLWVVTRRDDVMSIYKDMVTFSNGGAHQPLSPKTQAVIDRVGEQWKLPVDNNINVLDPPHHMTPKRVLVTVFQKALVGMDDWIVSRLNQLVDSFVADGEADLVSAFTWPLTVSVLSRLIGVPREDTHRFKEWAENWFELTGSNQLPPERAEACWMGFVDFEAFVFDLIEDRRKNPQHDLISRLVEAQGGGAPISDRQIVTNMIGLVAAGTDTTANSIGQMVYMLLSNPEQLREVRENPAFRPQMIEELLRLRGPVRGLIRTTTRMVELGGVAIPEGARVYVHIGSASRDETVFDDPHRFDIHRPNIHKHMAFGALSRLCLGAPLARLEMRKALDVLLDRLPDLRLAPDQGPLHYTQSLIVPSLKGLRVLWSPPASDTRPQVGL
ncbi:cytochrome P450 [uncultured Sphingosinicella sp.]|uniref:cytochrome P450 n=1 Tax=uncultured Sphingosinicella sp. TaxID=478748 RepID=UPI0030DB5DA2|tara:strand:- start:44919 stop:46217 length:1299 start_codon:yes stop_codon:yes gene_type:complete